MSPERAEASWFGQHRVLLGLVLAGFVLLGAAVSVVLGLWTSPPSAAASATLTPTPSAIATAEPTPLPEPSPTPNPFNRALLNNRYTVLVIGEDSDVSREARGKTSRTDSMIVISVSARQKKVTMLSVPRDMVDIPMSNGMVFTGKINGLAESYGYEGLVDAIATMLAVDIDAYVKIDMDNFVQLVDAVGGVRVKNTEWLNDGHLGLYLEPGTVKLDGATALDYVRSRYTTSDYARSARQQQVLLVLAHRFADRKRDLDVGALLPVMDSLVTDIDLAELPTLIEMGRRARRAEVVMMVLAPPRFSVGWGDQGDGRGWIILPNVDEMRAYARKVMGD